MSLLVADPAWFELFLSPSLKNTRNAGQVFRIVGIAEDITERKQAEQKITELVEKYQSLLENIPVAVYSTLPDETGTTLFISERWSDWTGDSPDDFYQDSETWPKSIHPDINWNPGLGTERDLDCSAQGP